ncbi:MAG: hypothetical protein ABIS36_06885 [Chryseolinea sp.]
MNRLIWGIALVVSMIACQDNNEAVKSEFSGNETVYALAQVSDYPVSGSVTFKEKVDGTTKVVVQLTGTEGNIEHPVHLHLGDITKPSVDVAALLTPVLGSTGKSETDLSRLSDESSITYKQILNLSACIKIHLGANGADRDVILTAGNIGAASAKDMSAGRRGVGVCKSE